MYHLENKGIVFKARWFVRLDITRARPLFSDALVISRKNNGHARVLSGRTNQTRFQNNTFNIFLFKYVKCDQK